MGRDSCLVLVDHGDTGPFRMILWQKAQALAVKVDDGLARGGLEPFPLRPGVGSQVHPGNIKTPTAHTSLPAEQSGRIVSRYYNQRPRPLQPCRFVQEPFTSANMASLLA